jgi:hypothetical protein
MDVKATPLGDNVFKFTFHPGFEQDEDAFCATVHDMIG